MRISVIGCGRWGSCIAWYLDSLGHEVSLYGRESSQNMQQLMACRSNDYLSLPESIRLSCDLQQTLEPEIIVISIPSQRLDALCREISAMGAENKTFVLCMKGIEIGSCRRLTQVAEQALPKSCRTAVWLGPGHVQEITARTPNCMVIDSAWEDSKRRLVELFSGGRIRFYYGTDLIGNEIGAAAKNVIGIAAGVLDGLGLSTMKGALMSRGTREIARLIVAMGGSELSAYGLCHLGDYEATVFSRHSQNRRFGEAHVRGESYSKLAEGYYTVRALMQLGENYGTELPISRAVYRMLYERADAMEEIETLLSRDLTQEF